MLRVRSVCYKWDSDSEEICFSHLLSNDPFKKGVVISLYGLGKFIYSIGDTVVSAVT